jgi:hypothetical protein
MSTACRQRSGHDRSDGEKRRFKVSGVVENPKLLLALISDCCWLGHVFLLLHVCCTHF